MAFVSVTTGIPLSDVKAWTASELATVLEVIGEHGSNSPGRWA